MPKIDQVKAEIALIVVALTFVASFGYVVVSAE